MDNKWVRVGEEKPPIGAKVLAWHPRYEAMLVYFGREGFYEANNGDIRDVASITHWMYLPSGPNN